MKISVEVTPRFEVFYALQALEGRAGKELTGWRRDAELKLPARVRTEISSVAPSPLMWPLLADSLRNAPESLTFEQVLSALKSLEAEDFQRFVLSGMFKGPRSVDRLIARSQTLQQVVEAESALQGKLLALLGLNPFARKSVTARAFQRIISEPGEYRAEVVSVMEAFWRDCFEETWQNLVPSMERVATTMRRSIEHRGFDEFAKERRLPASGDHASSVCIIPSAFNTSRLWAAYGDERGRTRYFIPVTDASLSLDVRRNSREQEAGENPSLVFKALGDTTRYAIASTIARNPVTSVELAKMFEVSKPTISHHVQALRAANLLIEQPGENGVVLSLNRDTLERASLAAAGEMFSGDSAANTVKRSRRANRRT